MVIGMVVAVVIDTFMAVYVCVAVRWPYAFVFDV